MLSILASAGTPLTRKSLLQRLGKYADEYDLGLVIGALAIGGDLIQVGRRWTLPAPERAS